MQAELEEMEALFGKAVVVAEPVLLGLVLLQTAHLTP
jgi:hypothetical protein